jgi:predicted Zn finger-like uncharacterized protein
VIITCEQCETQFQLDDSRIPERGARVRCSRCKHAFFVKPATEEAGDPVEQAVKQALAEDEEQRAGSTQELHGASPLRAEAEEESDWKFNDGSPDPGLDAEPEPDPDPEPDLAAAREAVDDLLGPVDEAPSEQPDDELLSTDSDVPAEADLDLGVDDDIDSLLDSSGQSDALEETQPDLPLEEEPPLASEEPESAVALAAEEPEERASEEELGSPENWDFFADEPEESLSGEADLERTPVGQMPLASQVTLERPPIDVDAEPPNRGQRLRQAAQAVGWLSVALLLVAGLHGGILAQRAGPVAMRSAQAAAGFEATAVEGRWLDNAAAGPIYVISGKLLGRGGWPAVRLLDENGVPLAEQAVVAGPPLPEARLREEDPRELRAEQAQKALAMAGAQMEPGDALRFQAILTHLPEAASRFDLAAIPD